MQKVFPTEKGTIDCERFIIPYRVYGAGKNIVCINGVQQSTAMWLSFIRYFHEKYKITLFDFPHQGKAKIKYGAETVPLDEEVEILHRVITELKLKDPIVCSASWGGVIALSLALKYPEDVRRLVLASIGMRPGDKMRSAILDGINIQNNDREKMAGVLIENIGKRLPERIKNQIYTQFRTMPDTTLEAFSRHGLSVLFKGSLEKVLPLEQIRTPTSIVYGKEDSIINYDDARELARKLPDAEIITVDDTGHFLHLEDVQVLKIYEDILSSR